MGIYKSDSKNEVMITVLMAVYNTQEEYLREAIESVLKQTYSEFEFIIINDCSDEKTREILKSYVHKDKRIRLIENEINLGLTKSLNIGLANAKGRYLARIDSDDRCVATRLEVQLKYMQSHPNTAVVGSRICDQHGKRYKVAVMPSEWRRVQLITSNCGVVHSSAFIDMNFLREHNLCYDETKKRSQDYKLWADISNCGGVIDIVPEELVMFRQHNDRISVKYKTEQDNTALMISCEQLAKFVTSRKPQDVYNLIYLLLIDSTDDAEKKKYKEELRNLLVQAIDNNDKGLAKVKVIYEPKILRYELMYLYNQYVGKQEWHTIGYWWYRVRRAIYKHLK